MESTDKGLLKATQATELEPMPSGPLHPKQQISAAQNFFAAKGFQIDEEGLLDAAHTTDEQIQDLAAWRESRCTNGIEMQTFWQSSMFSTGTVSTNISTAL